MPESSSLVAAPDSVAAHSFAVPPSSFAVPTLNGPSADDVTHAWQQYGGFLLLGVVPPDVCDALVEVLNAEVEAADARDRAEPWPTGFGDRLRASASGVVPFWDPTLPPSEDRAPTERLMRLGHQLQQVPEVAAVLRRPEILGALGLVLKSAELVDCVLIDKVPGGTVQFGAHQDSWYLRSEPDTLVSMQIALDDADAENGGLCLQGKAERDPPTCRAVLSGNGWSQTTLTAQLPPDEQVPPVTMARGSVLLYHGQAWHRSSVNRSNRHRRILVAQFKDASSRWLADNWLNPPAEGFPPWR
jgi:hypothetical protein